MEKLGVFLVNISGKYHKYIYGTLKGHYIEEFD